MSTERKEFKTPLVSQTFGKNKKTLTFIYPQIGNQIGMGALVKRN